MIVPNLVVADVARSVAFYRETLGFSLETSVAADQSYVQGDDCIDNPVFAIVSWAEGQLMLQTAASLAGDVPGVPEFATPHLTGAIYLRGLDPDAVATKLNDDAIVKGPETSWYGMRELYLRDPDGYLLCLGVPKGDWTGTSATSGPD